MAIHPRPARHGPERSRARGFALVVVLWASVLLALVAAAVSGLSRADLTLARNLAGAAEAELAAEAGVSMALHRLLTGNAEAWRTDGTVYGWRFGDAELRVSVTGEFGRVDLNAAAADLLAALFEAAGMREAEAGRLGQAVVAHREAYREALAAELAAGTDPSERQLQPFAVIEDLQRVPGMPPGLADGLADAVTVHSGRARPVLAEAPPIVRAALGAEPLPDPAAPARGTVEAPAGDGGPRAMAPGRAGGAGGGSGLYRIRAEALLPDGSHHARLAVVTLGARQGGAPYTVRLSRRADRRLFPPRPPSG